MKTNILSCSWPEVAQGRVCVLQGGQYKDSINKIRLRVLLLENDANIRLFSHEIVPNVSVRIMCFKTSSIIVSILFPKKWLLTFTIEQMAVDISRSTQCKKVLLIFLMQFCTEDENHKVWRKRWYLRAVNSLTRSESNFPNHLYISKWPRCQDLAPTYLLLYFLSNQACL